MTNLVVNMTFVVVVGFTFGWFVHQLYLTHKSK